MVFKGSRYNFSNIVFTRRFHPPNKNKGTQPLAGQWDFNTKKITVFLAGLKKAGYNVDDDDTHREITRILVHEVIHGVIDYILVKDDIDFEGIDYHYPHNNGMEYEG